MALRRKSLWAAKLDWGLVKASLTDKNL